MICSSLLQIKVTKSSHPVFCNIISDTEVITSSLEIRCEFDWLSMLVELTCGKSNRIGQTWEHIRVWSEAILFKNAITTSNNSCVSSIKWFTCAISKVGKNPLRKQISKRRQLQRAFMLLYEWYHLLVIWQRADCQKMIYLA